MAEWLLQWREHDASGYYWPAHIPLGHYKDRSRTRATPSLVRSYGGFREGFRA
jgi:hypothetical protein